MVLLGLISDTHGLLRPEAIAALVDVDLIIHAGDIGCQSVIDDLARLAPVHAIRGNIDKGSWADAYPEDEVVEIEGRAVYVIHRIQDLDLDPLAAGFDVVVSGHSHRPGIKRNDGVLFVNPGSAGPRRFTLPVTLATLELSVNSVETQIVELSV